MAVKYKQRAKKKFQSPGHYTKADREKIRHFAGPNKTFPIEIPKDIEDAARLVGHADNPEAVKRNIIRIAHQLGPEFVAKLPDAWTSDQGERMDTPTLPATNDELDHLALLQRAQDTFLEVADALGYDPLTLVERAKKAATDDEDEDEEDGDDESDEDESDDEGEDEDEEDVPPSKGKPGTGKFAPRFGKKAKRAEEPALTRGVTVKAFSTPNLSEIGFAHITRIDKEKWEVEGVVSNEEIDTFGTVFDYDSMKRAVESRWHGNVREQHDPKLAVGKGVFVFCDDDKREVRVRARVSRGAPNTWAKVEDGVLCGFSIGASNAKTVTRMVGDKSVPCYTDFDLAEISLVDAPSNPGAARSGLTLYRSATAVQGQEDVYADFLAADEVAAPAPALTESASADAAPSTAEPDTAPLTEAEIAARVAEAEAALLRGEAFGVPQVTSGTPEVNDTAAGAPVVPSGAELDSIDAAMHSDTGLTHVHSHAYSPSTVHMDQNAHHHSDGTQHAHHHMHGHVGHGDGKTPHVHGHVHDHNFQRAAADAKGASGFIAEGDPRVDEYLKLVRREQTPTTPPAVLSAKTAETNGKAASIPVPLATPTDAPASIPVPTQVSGGGTIPAPYPEHQMNALLAGNNAARVQTPSDERYGQRLSGDTRTGLHEGALAILRTCNCPYCQDAIQCYDPDNDGDDDVDEAGDTDNDAMLVMPRVQRAQLNRAVAQIVQQQTQPLTTQLRQIAARLAGVQTPELTRVQEQLDTVSAVLTALQGQVQQDSQLLRVIAEQEQPGAPVVRAADKRLAIHPTQQPNGMTPFSDDQLDFLRRQNLLNQPTADQQAALAAEVFNRRNP